MHKLRSYWLRQLLRYERNNKRRIKKNEKLYSHWLKNIEKLRTLREVYENDEHNEYATVELSNRIVQNNNDNNERIYAVG